MEQDKSKPYKPQQTQQHGTGQKDSVLSDKERFGDRGAEEKLRHMGEKTRETKDQKK